MYNYNPYLIEEQTKTKKQTKPKKQRYQQTPFGLIPLAENTPLTPKQAYEQEKKHLTKKLERDKYAVKIKQIRNANAKYDRAKREEKIYTIKKSVGAGVDTLKALFRGKS